jgi:hypothetical protein
MVTGVELKLRLNLQRKGSSGQNWNHVDGLNSGGLREVLKFLVMLIEPDMHRFRLVYCNGDVNNLLNIGYPNRTTIAQKNTQI